MWSVVWVIDKLYPKYLPIWIVGRFPKSSKFARSYNHGKLFNFCNWSDNNALLLAANFFQTEQNTKKMDLVFDGDPT